MSTRNTKDRLHDILDHIKKLDGFFQNISSLEVFVNSDKDIFAIAMCFVIIGEAAGHLSIKFIKQHQQIPWRNIKDMRNFAVHQYWEIRPEILWNTYYHDIKKLKIDIKNILN
jgi:uncharacterized protein with HEPN domain